MTSLPTPLEVGKITFIGLMTSSLGMGVLARGTETVQKTGDILRSDEGSMTTWQKARDVALASIGFLGICCVSLDWAQFIGWITLGIAAPIVSLIGYPAFAFTNGFLALREFQALSTLLESSDVHYHNWKIAAQVIRLLSKTCLVAVSILGGIGFVTGAAPLSLVAFLFLTISLILLGSAKVFDKNIAKWDEAAHLALA